MVTLSCWIVLASLFSQLNTNLPGSPSPKAIEILFCYYIVKLSYIFIAHTSLQLLQQRRMKNFLNSQITLVSSLPASTSSAASRVNISKVGPDLNMRNSKYLAHGHNKGKRPTSNNTPLSSETVNKVYFYLGIILDSCFIVVFFIYVYQARIKILNSFDEHQDFN